LSACSVRLADGLVLDWWTGELGSAEARRVERHLLSCAPCAARAQLLAAVSQGVRALVRQGRLPVALSPSVVERLRSEGRRIREYRVAPGGSVQCSVGPEDDVVLARLGVDLAGVTQLDLLSRVGDGPERRFADLPFDASTAELIVAPAIDMLRARPASVERMRLVAVDPQGEGERALGEYTFNHSPWR
jgi:Putative zinc-finger